MRAIPGTRPRRTVWLAAAVTLGVFALTACAGDVSDETPTAPTGADTAPTAPGGDTPATPDAEEPADAAAGCVVGEWTLDTENAGTQLWAFLQSAGIAQVGDVDVSGESRLSITSGGDFALSPNLDLAATMDMHGIGAVLWQHHGGQFRARWIMDDPGTMRFDAVSVNEYTVDQALTMGGTDVPAPIDIPPPVGADMPLNISCEGDTLIYSPPDAPITSVWRRVG